MNLKSVKLPGSLVSIGESAFAGCVSLNAVNFGSSLVNIENNAFSGCKELASPDFPDNLEKIGSGAFSGCAFKNVTLGKNIMEIGEFAFGSTGQNELDYKIVYIPDFVINGYSSTAAQSYAESCGIKFVDIENQSPEKTEEFFDYGVFIKGDVNLDGKVSVLDATLICKWLAEGAELNPVQLSNALVCESYGTINITNAANIQKYVVGLIDSLDGGGAAG